VRVAWYDSCAAGNRVCTDSNKISTIEYNESKEKG
jgi:hypothetical protein